MIWISSFLLCVCVLMCFCVSILCKEICNYLLHLITLPHCPCLNLCCGHFPSSLCRSLGFSVWIVTLSPLPYLKRLTVLEVSMGGLSLMSVTVMMAVAVLERPKFRFPSISVACTMTVYWDTFCTKAKNGKRKKKECVVIHLQKSFLFLEATATATDCDSRRDKKKGKLRLCCVL